MFSVKSEIRKDQISAVQQSADAVGIDTSNLRRT